MLVELLELSDDGQDQLLVLVIKGSEALYNHDLSEVEGVQLRCCDVDESVVDSRHVSVVDEINQTPSEEDVDLLICW